MLKPSVVASALTVFAFSTWPPAKADTGHTLPLRSHTLDWVPLKELTASQRQALPPGSCGAYIAPVRSDAEANLLPSQAPIRASANQSTLFQKNHGQGDDSQVILIGDVVVTQGYRQLLGNNAQIDQGEGTLVMEGELQLREPGLLVLGDRISVDQQQDTAIIDNATYVLHDSRIRGQARQIDKTATDIMVLSKAHFTSCEPGNNTWILKGSKITLDPESRQGHGTHVRLVVKGIPVFYFPYLRFPLGNERLSGFLSPTFNFSDEGNEISIPYYFNLAPNYDLIFTPHFLEQHGVLYESNFRHLSRHFFTAINGTHLSDDKAQLDDNEQSLVDQGTLTLDAVAPFRDQDRWVFNVDQSGSGSFWSSTIDYTKASDINYFRDFDSPLADSDDNFLDQKILTDYRYGDWQFAIDLVRYQTLSTSVSTPFEQLPALEANYGFNFGETDYSRWALDLDHQWVRFDHEDADDPNPRLTGDRLRTNYRLGWELDPEWGFVRPGVQVKHLQYRLNDNNFAAGADRSPALTVPQFTLDSGLFFERDGRLAGHSYLQTFEPRLFYFYSDFEDHSPLFDLTTNGQDIDFDTSSLTFSYSQLFRDTRFAGGDRIDDANQLSIGLTTRFIGNESGREWFSASLGQIQFFDDRRVTLNNNPETLNRSGIAGQLSLQPSANWRISSDLLYDDRESELDRGNLKLRYQNARRHLFELDYRFTRASSDSSEDTEQINASIIAPLFNPRWHLLFYGAHDITRDRELDAISAIEYNGCCYRIRFGYRSELDNSLAGQVADEDLDYKYSTFFEIHFKGLGGAGQQLDSLLDENIDGYTDWQSVYQQ